MEFSPNEAFIISYSAEEPQGRQDRASLTLNVFDSFTGACCDVTTSPSHDVDVRIFIPRRANQNSFQIAKRCC